MRATYQHLLSVISSTENLPPLQAGSGIDTSAMVLDHSPSIDKGIHLFGPELQFHQQIT